MPPLSTSSSDLRECLRRLAFQLVVTIIVLAAAEGAVQVAVLVKWLPSPDPLLWHRREVAVKLSQIEELEAEQGIDILFVGSSVSYTGIDPSFFDLEYMSVTGTPITSYNAGLAALPVALVDSFVEEVFSNYTSPNTIILLLSPRDMNNNNPINQSITEEVMSSTYGQALMGSGPKAYGINFALENSMLFRYRNTIALAVINGFRIPTSLPDAYDDPEFDERGYAPSFARLSDQGSQAHVPGYDQGVLSLRKYDPAGEYTAALEDLIRFCRNQDILLVVVNMPVNQHLMACFEHPLSDYQLYLETVTTLTEMYHIPFWDLNSSSESPLFTDDDFGDIFHLNHQGARELTSRITHLYTQLGNH